MHAGVFRPRISEEAFQVLLDVVQSNLAALTLPAERNLHKSKKQAKKSGRVIKSPNLHFPPMCQLLIERSYERSAFRDNFKVKVSQHVTAGNKEITGVLEIIFPISCSPKTIEWPCARSIMTLNKSPDESQEPMEIEEISYTEPSTKPDSRHKKNTESSNSTNKESHRKNILRESRLSYMQDVKIKTEKPEIPAPANLSAPPPEKLDQSANRKSKSKLRSLVKSSKTDNDEKQKTSLFNFWRTAFFILFSVAVLVVTCTFTRGGFNMKSCEHSFDATRAIRELRSQLFGQAEAIEQLDLHLPLNSSQTKVFALIGGAGIGKSYAAHIIRETFPVSRNVFQYTQPLESKQGYAVGLLSICGCNLIILENLGLKDITDAVRFAAYVSRMAAQNYCVLIVEVVNVQTTDNDLKHTVDLLESRTEIESAHRILGLHVEVIEFQPLDDDMLTKCILYAARTEKILLTKNQIEDIRLGLRSADSGCKGAHAKVQLLNKKSEL